MTTFMSNITAALQSDIVNALNDSLEPFSEILEALGVELTDAAPHIGDRIMAYRYVVVVFVCVSSDFSIKED